MKYEFHVGDYVEREVADGTNLKTLVGYVTFYRPIMDSHGCGHSFEFTWRDGTKDVGAYTDCELPLFFKRIGQYDFTKPEQPKEIDFLPENWMDTPEKRKVNELVDAVNELKKGRT